MKMGRPKASMTIPGRGIGPPMGKPGMAPPNPGTAGLGGGFSKGGRSGGKPNNSKNPEIQPAGTRKKPTIESKSKVRNTNLTGLAKGGSAPKKKKKK